jgi:hypothetical protein
MVCNTKATASAIADVDNKIKDLVTKKIANGQKQVKLMEAITTQTEVDQRIRRFGELRGEIEAERAASEDHNADHLAEWLDDGAPDTGPAAEGVTISRKVADLWTARLQAVDIALDAFKAEIPTVVDDDGKEMSLDHAATALAAQQRYQRPAGGPGQRYAWGDGYEGV